MSLWQEQLYRAELRELEALIFRERRYVGGAMNISANLDYAERRAHVLKVKLAEK